MIKIKINSYPQHALNTFLYITPTKHFHVVGEPFVFEEFSNENYLGIKYLIHKETISISDVSDAQSYLAKNCDKKLFYQILKNQYKTRLTQERHEMLSPELQKAYKVGDLYTFINKQTIVDVLTFTDRSCIKSLNENLAFVFEKKKLTSDRYLLTKDYDFAKYQQNIKKKNEFLDKTKFKTS